MIDTIFIFSLIGYFFIYHKIEYWTSIHRLGRASGNSEVPSSFIKYKNLYKLTRNILFLIALGLSFFLEKIPTSFPVLLPALIVFAVISEKYINKKIKEKREEIRDAELIRLTDEYMKERETFGDVSDYKV